jgi:hypothetical protein
MSRACLGAALALAACSTEASGPPASVTPPACASVQHFGNGEACDKDGPDLASCGTASTRACVTDWLCFDAASLVDCSCTVDADCLGRLQYINDARSTHNKSPIASKCLEGRCSGRP